MSKISLNWNNQRANVILAQFSQLDDVRKLLEQRRAFMLGVVYAIVPC